MNRIAKFIFKLPLMGGGESFQSPELSLFYEVFYLVLSRTRDSHR